MLRAGGESIAARAEGRAGARRAGQGAAADPAAGEHRWTIKGDGKLRVTRDGAPLSAFEITAIANQKPTIALTARPQANVRDR